MAFKLRAHVALILGEGKTGPAEAVAAVLQQIQQLLRGALSAGAEAQQMSAGKLGVLEVQGLPMHNKRGSFVHQRAGQAS